MWDKETTQAIKESIEHWEENVKKLQDGEVLFVKDYQSHSCPLCSKFGPTFCATNNNCPLNVRGIRCNDDSSPWDMFNDEQTIENARNMVLALKSLFYPEPEKKEVFYHAGQRIISNYNDEYILSQVDTKMIAFIRLKDGNRKSAPVKVDNAYKITGEKVNEAFGLGTFKLKESK